ncbi:MAG: hypothetical protein BIFFINMI_02318 [Phycisphaerae bacterium]|nr:hypothetical protein [Phycisphaerae bacterium]
MTRSTATPTPDDPRTATRAHLRSVMVAWIFGAAWMALVTGAPFIRFSEEMGLRDESRSWVWGILSAIPFIGTLFQMLGSYWIERSGRRKALFVVGNLIQRFTWMGVAAVPWLMVPGTWAAVLSVMGLVLLHATSGAMAAPAWTSWMADIIPPRLRGRYFGLRSQLGLSIIIPVSLAAGWLLQASRTGVLAVPVPDSLTQWHLTRFAFGLSTLHVCMIFFTLAAPLGMIDILCFLRVPDVPSRGEDEPPPSLREIFGPPLRNREFRRFLLFYGVLILGTPGAGNYFWLYVLNDVAVGEAWAQAIFMVTPAIGAILMAALWGRLLDRYGRKTLWRMTVLLPCFIPMTWIFVRPSSWPVALILTFVGGICWNGIDQATFNGLLHFTGTQSRSSSYQAVFALVASVAGCLSGLLFAGIAKLTGPWTLVIAGHTFHHARFHLVVAGVAFNRYHVIFMAAGLLRLTSYLFMLPGVRDDSREPVRVAMRYVFTNVYNTIYTRLSFPLRIFGAAIRKASYSPDGDAEDDADSPAPPRTPDSNG